MCCGGARWQARRARLRVPVRLRLQEILAHLTLRHGSRASRAGCSVLACAAALQNASVSLVIAGLCCFRKALELLMGSKGAARAALPLAAAPALYSLPHFAYGIAEARTECEPALRDNGPTS